MRARCRCGRSGKRKKWLRFGWNRRITSCWRRITFRSAYTSHADEKAAKILSLLPQRDCGACGYESCYSLAIAIAEGKEKPDACRIAGKRIARDVEAVLKGD